MKITAAKSVNPTVFQITRGRKGKLAALKTFSNVQPGIAHHGGKTSVLVECSEDGARLIAKDLALDVYFMGVACDFREDPEFLLWMVVLTRPVGTMVAV